MKNIPNNRVHLVEEAEARNGKYVLHWCTGSYRTVNNYGLEYAIGLAERGECSVVVGVHISKKQNIYSERQVAFRLQGVQDLEKALRDREVKLVVQICEPQELLQDLGKVAASLVTDYGYLDHHQSLLKVATTYSKDEGLHCVAIESNIVVPVETASDKQEYAARTIRRKLMEQYEDYVGKPRSSKVPVSSLSYSVDGVDLSNIQKLISQLKFEHTAEIVDTLRGGEIAAKKHLESFLDNALEVYDSKRQSPTDRAVSKLSSYLAAGHIAPAYIIKRAEARDVSTDSFIEELLVRRKLAINFVHYSELR